MKSEYKLFGILAVFLFGCTAIYAAWTARGVAPMNPLERVDWVGTMALLLSGLLCLMLGGYFWFVARRIELRPEDRPDAEIHEGAGEVGFFSPGSYWPVGIAAAAATAAIGTAFMLWWLVVAGLLSVVAAASGMLFEYYSGTRRAAEH